MHPAVRAAAAIAVSVILLGTGLSRAAAQDKPPEAPPAPPPAAPEFTPPKILAQRRKGLKEKDASAAVAAGLGWLRRHQAADGRWDADGFPGACAAAACANPGFESYDVGVTALATLAFLGAGQTHVEGPDADVVARALTFLVGVQDSNGCVGPMSDRHFVYGHSLATMALAEALWLTGDAKLTAPASRARDFLHEAQNPYLGWRYCMPFGRKDGDNDSSVTAYAVTAIRTCEFAGLDVDRSVYAGALAWFGKMSDKDSGRVGYQQRGGPDARCRIAASHRVPEPEPEPRAPPTKPGGPHTPVPRPVPTIDPGPVHTDAGLQQSASGSFRDDRCSALTAAAAAATTLSGRADAAALVNRWSAVLSLVPPSASRAGYVDLHYLHFGSLFHAQRTLDVKPQDADDRKVWRPWRDAVVADLTAAQCAAGAGCAAGSWNADLDPFGAVGGRVYSTAMALLALQAPNRFPKVWDPRRK